MLKTSTDWVFIICLKKISSKIRANLMKQRNSKWFNVTTNIQNENHIPRCFSRFSFFSLKLGWFYLYHFDPMRSDFVLISSVQICWNWNVNQLVIRRIHFNKQPRMCQQNLFCHSCYVFPVSVLIHYHFLCVCSFCSWIPCNHWHICQSNFIL